MEIQTPEPFNFAECLRYLNRSELELSHKVADRTVFKLITIDGVKTLVNVSLTDNNNLLVKVLNREPSLGVVIDLENYVTEWFDLDTPLDQFYAEVGGEKIFRYLTQRFYGLRMLKIPELFEAICWSIIGQQINLGFAYQIKNNLVRSFGEYLDFEGCRYYSFPTPDKISEVEDEVFRALQFSKQKTVYIKDVTEKFVSGDLSKGKLQSLSPEELKQTLMEIKGIGNWSANYIMMRCLGIKEAFPIEDIGLHHALKNLLDLKSKPTIAEVRELCAEWKTWQGYRTYYLWHSLTE